MTEKTPGKEQSCGKLTNRLQAVRQRKQGRCTVACDVLALKMSVLESRRRRERED
ncbi:MAG: hypothetical protein PVJ55_07895 [Anaerolineae bacterium]